MIRCVRCNKLMPRDPWCSDLAVIAVHWMERHPGAYIEMHPECAPYLRRFSR